jgi:hypothetical protein
VIALRLVSREGSPSLLEVRHTHTHTHTQPTKPWCKEEEDFTSWLTPAFLVLPKTKTRQKLESLPRVWSQSHLMSFSEIEIFSSMTLVR